MSRRITGSRVALALVSTSALAATALLGTSASDAATAHHAKQPHVAADLSAGHMTPAVYGAPRTRVGSVAGIRANVAGQAATFGCQTTSPEQCFGPADIRHAYGIDQIQGDGTGQTIAIVDAFSPPNVKHDLDLFDQVFGLPAADLTIATPNGTTAWNPNDENQVGWSGEIALDVEWAHAVAPGAKIVLVEAKTNDDVAILKAVRYAVQKSGADILSQSFGENEACQDPLITKKSAGLYRKAARAGMSVFASSGDQGSAQPTCDGNSFVKAVSLPAADPMVTAVGGTELTANPGGVYQSETTWDEPDYSAAGGGGISTLVKAPAYQKGVTGNSMRTVPDIAYNAGIDTTGVLTVWSNSGQGADLAFGFGGTSAGSPQWAGLAALANQTAGHDLGQLNTSLYALAGDSSSYADDFHDITTGDNTYHGMPQTIPGFEAGTGYDLATGLGTPQAQNLVRDLAGVAVQ